MCDVRGYVMSSTSRIYWVDLDFINNYKEPQLWLVLLRYSVDVASAFPWVVTKIKFSNHFLLSFKIFQSIPLSLFFEICCLANDGWRVCCVIIGFCDDGSGDFYSPIDPLHVHSHWLSIWVHVVREKWGKKIMVREKNNGKENRE